MRKQPPATNPALTAAVAAPGARGRGLVPGLLALAACTGDAPAPTTAEVDALAQSVKDAITTDALMTWSAAITEHVRPSGSPGENAAIDTIVATLRARGVPVVVHELSAYASDPVSASVTIPGTDFAPDAITMAYSAASAGTVGEVVDMGTLADLPRLEVGTGERLVIEREGLGADLPDLSGKVAIVDGQPRNVPTIALERMGAAAVVFINPEERLNELIVTSTWGSPSLMNHHRLPTIPVAQIARSGGEELRARMAAGPVELSVATELATGWKPMRLAVATIEPAGPAGAPYVVLGGHIDGWHHAATDEAAANAAMLAMALAFHDVRDQLRHGLVVAWWPGHSNARYAGSTWFADEFFTDLRTRGLAYMNIDGIGQTGARIFGASTSEAFRPFATRVVAETQGEEISPSRPGRNSDQIFNGVGLPLIQFSHTRLAEDGGYWWWHTTEDTYDKIGPEVLKTDTDIYVHALATMLAGPRYPVSLTAQVEALGAAIEARDAAAGGALQLDLHLGNRVERLRRVATDMDARADAGEIGPLDLVAFLRPLHRVMYVPLNDYHPDPGVSLGPLPGLAPARILLEEEPGSDRRGFAAPVLARERNRLIEAIDEALDVGYMRTTLASIRQEMADLREERDR